MDSLTIVLLIFIVILFGYALHLENRIERIKKENEVLKKKEIDELKKRVQNQKPELKQQQSANE